MKESEFQAQVVEYAELMGCRVLHVRKSVGKGKSWTTATNIVGWPDLQIMRPPDLIVWAELKVGANKASSEQREVVEFLDGFAFGQAFVWTPADWPQIEEVLKRKRSLRRPPTPPRSGT